MCGIRLPIRLMVPDGGSACSSVRWYCQDKRACTDRWVTHCARLTAARQRAAQPPQKQHKKPAALTPAKPKLAALPR
jgi:hypothetical protein